MEQNKGWRKKIKGQQQLVNVVTVILPVLIRNDLVYTVKQACQTQTTLGAAIVTKIDEGATKKCQNWC